MLPGQNMDMRTFQITRTPYLGRISSKPWEKSNISQQSQEGQLWSQSVFSWEPFCQVQGQTGQELRAVLYEPREGKWLQSGEVFLKHSKTQPFTISQAQTSTARGPSNKPVQEVTIPSSIGLLSFELDVALIKEFSHLPVGGRLSWLRQNWEKVTQDSSILQTVQG